MACSSFRRLAIPWRNDAVALLGTFHRVAACAAFSIRHLPRFAFQGWRTPLPPLLKRVFLDGAAQAFGATTFVETGTYLGDTSWWLRNRFGRIHTIEVDPFLHAQARRRFRRLPHVTAHLGDSAAVLPRIIPTIANRAMYWLDGHYSAGITGSGAADCPVIDELRAIYALSKWPFLILIDDAECFGRDPGYPTLPAVRELVATLSDGRHEVVLENGVIFVRQSADGLHS